MNNKKIDAPIGYIKKITDRFSSKYCVHFMGNTYGYYSTYEQAELVLEELRRWEKEDSTKDTTKEAQDGPDDTN